VYSPRERFKPKKFLKLAAQLIRDNDYEEPCRVRTAIGRAYYSAFLYAKERLERLGQAFPDDHTVHQAVIDRLMERNFKLLGSQLDELLEARRDADYYMDVPLSISQGNHFISLSQRFISSIDQL